MWLDEGELRVGLGCMRLSTDGDRDEARALATVAAALSDGVTVFDTAHAYGLGDAERGHNERLLGRALRGHGRARVVTKGGMTRPHGDWQPDGRGKSILADCQASLRALDGVPIDLYLLHAPDPRAPFATTVRALRQLVDDKLVARVGVCNVNRRQLREALDLAPLSAVQLPLGSGSDGALRGGVVSLALECGLWVMAHSPFGGSKRAARLQRDKQLARIARDLGGGVTPAQLVLAWLLSLHPRVMAIPGARRPETARQAAQAARLSLSPAVQQLLDERFGSLAPPAPATGDGEVVLVAGLSGAGKSTHAAELVARGYQRLNRDERGGTLASIAETLDRKLAQGTRRFVLDNTYVTRASRHDVVRIAARHGVPVRCLWLDTPLVDAQRNVIERMLSAHGRLLSPDEMNGDDPTRLPPRALNNQVRQLEPPEDDEGFARLERVPFEMKHVLVEVEHVSISPEVVGVAAAAAVAGAACAVAVEALSPGLHPELVGPRLVFAWLPDGEAPLHAATAGLNVETAACTHPAGPPLCWCRPPLPGLLLAFARRHGIDLRKLTVLGTSTAHRKMAEAAGCPFVEVS
jgi:aryl-alcohol dehydrogenase-like predicted oxidoreductase/adenylate kinase family enzyme